jgi:preprotein translocase subunit SecG
MMIFMLAKVHPAMSAVGIVWSVIAVAIILIILVQKGKGGGLSAAFGGAGGGGLLGTKTGDFLTWVTISLVILFLLLTLVMVKWYKDTGSEGLEGELTPATTEQPLPGTETPLPSGVPAEPTTDAPTPAEEPVGETE